MSAPVADPNSVLRATDRRDWDRHPVDVAHLALRTALLAAVLALTAAFPAALTTASSDLVRLFNALPSAIRYLLVSVTQLGIVVIPAVIVGWLVARRTRLLAVLVIGAAVAGGIVMVLLTDWLNRAAPPAAITGLPSRSVIPTDFPSAAYLCALVAGASVATRVMPRLWRPIAWGAVVATALVRMVSATQASVSILVTLSLGSAIGALALVVFGAPRRRPGSASLRAALAAGGFDVDGLADEEVRRARRVYAAFSDGRPVRVSYLDHDDRDAELFARLVRSIKVREVDEQRVSSRPRMRAAQLALATTMAERAGVRVPAVLTVVPAERDSAIYVTESPPGQPLYAIDPDDVPDAALDDAWTQLARLHAGRIAHRALSAGHVYVDGDEATLTGLDTALLAASDESRAVDVAELLVATALVVGKERALDAAVRVNTPDVLDAALPFLQEPALPAHLQRRLGRKNPIVADLRTALQDRLGVEAVELAELERISIAKVVTWVGFGVLAYFLISVLANWADIRDTMGDAQWGWAIPAFVATILGTVGGAMSLSGSVTRPIALGDATIVMFGQSFLNRFTPMNAGGMAMRIRFLQRGGTDSTVATAAIGLTSAVSGVLQVLLLGVFLLWSSSDATEGLLNRGGDRTLDLRLLIVAAVAVVVAVLVIALTPKFRRWVVGFVRSTVGKIRHDFGELARRPSKLGLLFAGALIAKLSTLFAFVFACRAFGIGVTFATLCALYMIANTIASTVPSPGGVGAIEAALVLVLMNAGVDEAVAWAAVLLFRMINYWFPTIPGYLGLQLSERRGLV